MNYLVTLIETTEHIVEVEADDECLARAGAVMAWHDGDLIDDSPRLIDLEAVSIIEVPMEDVA